MTDLTIPLPYIFLTEITPMKVNIVDIFYYGVTSKKYSTSM